MPRPPDDRDTSLRRLLAGVAQGTPPPADGRVTVIRSGPADLAGVLAFTGHHVVVADVDEAWVDARLDRWDMSAPVGPAFVAALAEHLGRPFDNLDLVLVGTAGPIEDGAPLDEVEADPGHARIARSLSYRRDVRVFADADRSAVLIVARGLGDRWEAAFEVAPEARGRGLGRRLATAALGLVPPGEPLFLQVSPGNVASLRAVLATGRYLPVGAEILFPPPAASEN